MFRQRVIELLRFYALLASKDADPQIVLGYYRPVQSNFDVQKTLAIATFGRPSSAGGVAAMRVRCTKTEDCAVMLMWIFTAQSH